MTIERIDYTRCSGCLKCVRICPMDVFRVAGREVYLAYPDDCQSCYLCEQECPEDALYVSPQRTMPRTLAW